MYTIPPTLQSGLPRSAFVHVISFDLLALDVVIFFKNLYFYENKWIWCKQSSNKTLFVLIDLHARA